MFTERARAKINLTLHVGAPIDQAGHRFFGYHPLDSLVAFADIGDELTCREADKLSLSLSGPFSGGLDADENNLVLRAYHVVSQIANVPPLHFHLIKNLPVASGIGGGSADAAAALRLMQNYVDLPEDSWFEIAVSLGADVPVCLRSQTVRMTGIGDELQEIEDETPINVVLVNPGVAVSTAKIFKAYDESNPIDLVDQSQWEGDLVGQALRGRNDLEPVAMKMEPQISQVLRGLATQNGCELARMSGSGATCFGLFANKGHASAARARLSNLHPEWWVRETVIGEVNR